MVGDSAESLQSIHMTWLSEWTERRIAIAERLAASDSAAERLEAVLILGTVISALAAQRWPGMRIDKVRFVQLLIEADPKRATMVSVPLLVDHLLRHEMTAQAAKLRIAMNLTEQSALVYGEQVDVTEEKVIATCSDVKRQTIREHSYACVLYTDVRSAYDHQYQSGARADSRPMSLSRDSLLSYDSHIRQDGTSERVIYMSVPFLVQLTIAAAAYCDVDSEVLAVERPAKWWIKGD